MIRVGETPVHHTIAEVLNDVFNYNYERFAFGHKLPENDEYVIWFPKLSNDGAGRGDVDWLNLLSDDGRELVSSWNGNPAGRTRAEQSAVRYIDRKQIVFANRLGDDGYEFLGVFVCQRVEHGGWVQPDGKRHYERIATAVDAAVVRTAAH